MAQTTKSYTYSGKDYKYSELEPAVLKFWETEAIYQNLKTRNANNKKFYFLQGPPYTSGRIHIGHAWNNTLKDQILRYKRMRGLNVWDRGGYDMHGLPTENKVQEILKLKTKKDIEKHGIEPFIKECIKFSSEIALLMNKDLWRLGVWMDHENAYWPIRNSFISGEWWLIKKAEEHNRLYKKERVMQWCASCETALAKHELEYETVKENSIFLKFKIIGRVDDKAMLSYREESAKSAAEYLIIWTTTPWTIPYNLAVMVNPELDYVKAEVADLENTENEDNKTENEDAKTEKTSETKSETKKEVWYVAKALVGPLIAGVANKQFRILSEFKGQEMLGIKYEHPLYKDLKDQFSEIEKKSPRVHTVILTKEYCDTSAGSGLVHSAPGCGPEDYEVCEKYGIPAFNNLDERGVFQNMGKLNGLVAKKDDHQFILSLKEAGSLIAESEVEHEYAHCWRCHQPVIFRTTLQWFLKTEDLREKILNANNSVLWVPLKSSKSFEDWIKNLRDNSITRQRYWGTPVPIWECEKCKKYIVIGSAEELKQKSITGKIPEDLHKPWIDEVKVRCECGEETYRVPDVLDVWIDSGTVSWNCLDWPENKQLMKEYFPADLILEATEQARLWFSMLMIASFVSMDKPSYKAVYNHGMILDYQGMKMSKSLGNIISSYEVLDKYGADVLRFYMCAVTAGENINFSWEDVKIRQRYLTILWNIHKYLIELCRLNKANPDKLMHAAFDNLAAEEAYILSKLNTTIKKTTELYEQYKLDETIEPVTELFLELSRTYIQLTREKSAIGTDAEKQTVIKTIHVVLLDSLKMLSTICPFITEAIYQNIRSEFGLKTESIHYFEWPYFVPNFINEELEKQMSIAKTAVQGILSCREKASKGVRWPLLEAVIVTTDEQTRESLLALEELIKRQTNIKELIVIPEFKNIKIDIKLNSSKLGKDFGKNAPKVMAYLVTKNLLSVYHKIKQDGNYPLHIGNETFQLTEEHLLIEKQIPKEFSNAALKGMEIYLNTTLTKELEAEGLCRELIRRIQQSRKQASLEKHEEIKLAIKADEETLEMIKQTQEKRQIQENIALIKTKAGAIELVLIKDDKDKPKKKYTNTEEFKIKEKQIKIFFEKV